MAENASTRDVARRLNISQSAAARKMRTIRAGMAALELARRAELAKITMYCVVSTCSVIITAALATLAWGG